MDLGKILTIAGKNGLFRVVTQSKTTIIVESLIDGKRFPVFPTDRSSALQDISVFTQGEDLPLRAVLLRLIEKEDGKPGPDSKSDAEKLRAYFETVVPEFDKERVYNSDIKKIVSWYNLLIGKKLITKEDLAEEPAADDQPGQTEDEPSDVKPKAAKPAKKPGTSREKQPSVKSAKIDAGQKKTRQKK